MNPEFWLKRWQEGRTGWQEAGANALLQRHFASLTLPSLTLSSPNLPGHPLPAQPRILVPLCGATPDIGWLMAQGAHVIGAELSPLAITQLFQMLGLTPTSTPGRLTHHSAAGIDVFEGDIFDLTAELTGPIHAIYDRAALFALPPDIRPRYAAHLIHLSQAAPQWLSTLHHDQTTGPPFSITQAEVQRLYGPHYRITLADSTPTTLFGPGTPARSDLWLLQKP